MKLILLYFFCVVAYASAAVSWAIHSKPIEDPNEQIRLQSRAYLPPRYANLFGSKSHIVKGGAAFLPQQISDVTGKLGNLRKETFSWQPSRLYFDARSKETKAVYTPTMYPPVRATIVKTTYLEHLPLNEITRRIPDRSKYKIKDTLAPKVLPFPFPGRPDSKGTRTV